MQILTIETTCDETAAAVVTDELRVLSSVVASQDQLHRRFAGVVPEIAARAHVERILPVIDEALTRANIGLAEFLDADRAFIDEAYAKELGDHSVVADDVLVAGLGDESRPVGRACVAPHGIEPAIVKADCFRFRIDGRRVLPHFAAYQLSATAVAAEGSFAHTFGRWGLSRCHGRGSK